MAGIGDYVHARKVHYDSNGLSLYNGSSPPSVDYIYRSQIQVIKAEAVRNKFTNHAQDKARIEQ